MSKKLRPSEEYAPIFNRLIKLCETKGTSISQLLDIFASSRSAVGAWKNGNINANLIEGIAKHLNVSVEYLITGKENTYLPTTIHTDELEQEKIKSVNAKEQRLLNAFRALPLEEQFCFIGKMEQAAENYNSEENVG